jgi:hypothetical protein
LILALPLPIPLTNVLAAIPILILGFGLLEEDGIAIVIAYFFALICFTAFFLMVWLSKVGLHLIK